MKKIVLLLIAIFSLNMVVEASFPVTENQSKRILTLPINQHLTEHEIQIVSQTVNSFYER